MLTGQDSVCIVSGLIICIFKLHAYDETIKYILMSSRTIISWKPILDVRSGILTSSIYVENQMSGTVLATSILNFGFFFFSKITFSFKVNSRNLPFYRSK